MLERGQKSYAEKCAMCHGQDASGGEMGPKLAGNRRVRSRSTQQLRTFIYEGSPSNGMPAFHLPAPELDALAAFVHALNASAAESGAPGDAAAGEQIFFGKGQCGTCHMVRGRGKAIGPDRVNVCVPAFLTVNVLVTGAPTAVVPKPSLPPLGTLVLPSNTWATGAGLTISTRTASAMT